MPSCPSHSAFRSHKRFWLRGHRSVIQYSRTSRSSCLLGWKFCHRRVDHNLLEWLPVEKPASCFSSSTDRFLNTQPPAALPQSSEHFSHLQVLFVRTHQAAAPEEHRSAPVQPPSPPEAHSTWDSDKGQQRPQAEQLPSRRMS